MKTAMQELIDKFNSNNTVRELFDWIYDNQQQLLEKEKQQIVDAYDEGIERNLSFKSGEEFYTNTYN